MHFDIHIHMQMRTFILTYKRDMHKSDMQLSIHPDIRSNKK